MGAVAYIRVSTGEQELGIEAQRKAISEWALSNRETPAFFVDKGLSGGLAPDERPALMAAIQHLTKGDKFVVAKRDRIARDVMIDAMIHRLIEKKGAEVVSVDGTGNGDGPEAQLMRTIVAAFAAFERAMISSRTKAALQAKRDRGEVTGTPPYGTRVSGGKLIREDYEWSIVRNIMLPARKKDASYHAIADKLNEYEVPTRYGGKWYATTVRRICLFWNNEKHRTLLEKLND